MFEAFEYTVLYVPRLQNMAGNQIVYFQGTTLVSEVIALFFYKTTANKLMRFCS